MKTLKQKSASDPLFLWSQFNQICKFEHFFPEAVNGENKAFICSAIKRRNLGMLY